MAIEENRGLRVSEADRNRVARQLNDAYAAGLLSLDESTERIAQVQDAVYQADLAALVADLPPVSREPVASPVPAARPSPAAKPVNWLVSLFGDARRSGRWRSPEQTVCITPLGDMNFDYRDAVFDKPESNVMHITIFGDTEITVSPDARVETQSFTIFGDQDGGNLEGTSPDAPIIRVRHFSIFGDLKIRQ